MDTFPLKDVRPQHDENEKVCEWKYVTDDELEGKWRIYYKPQNEIEEDRHGFYFYAVAWAGNYCDDPTWSPETFIDTLYHGVALFDGLRHVYLGSDEDGIYGYTNYPDPNIHIQIWQALAKLEAEYCYDVQR